jgi:hypothetical protein
MKTNDTAPRITHAMVNTGDMQSVSLTDSNFDPEVIAITRSMVTESVMDFRIVIVSEPGSKLIFDVLHGGSAVSRNTVLRDAEGNIDHRSNHPVAPGVRRPSAARISDAGGP